MPGLPQISVVTPSFNSVSTISETIESVRTQDYTNWEHIVVDGGSQDGTVAVCDELRKRFPLRLISRRPQNGLSGAVESRPSP